MIKQEQVDEIQRLLASGKYSQRKIAKITKVSRGTINAISQGKRSDYVPAPKVEERGPFEGPIERCPECGGRVHMPCRFCQARRFASEESSGFRGAVPKTIKQLSLGLELKGESLKRYEEVRQKRLLQGEISVASPDWEDEDDDFLPEMYFTSLIKKGEFRAEPFLV